MEFKPLKTSSSIKSARSKSTATNESVKLENLCNERNRCVQAEEYSKADILSKQINEYKVQAIENQKHRIFIRHEKEMKTYEENYSRDLQEFKEKWMSKEHELHLFLEKQEQQWLNNQKEEIQFLYNNCNKTVKPKSSAKILNLRKIQYELVKQERFSEAERTKKFLEQLQKEEKAKLDIDRKNNRKKQIEKAVKKHQDELIRYNDEKERKRYMLQREKDQEYDIVMNKYKNLKIEIELQQKEENTKEMKKWSKFHIIIIISHFFSRIFNEEKITGIKEKYQGYSKHINELCKVGRSC